MDGVPAPSPPPLPIPLFYSRPKSQTLNAVSFGFIATAVLFALFLVMAIFERLLRPHRSFILRAARDVEQAPRPSGPEKPELRREGSYSDAVSVVMPGQDFPTYFARPIPSALAPDGVDWPSHGESSEPSQIRAPYSSRNLTEITEKGATSEKRATPSS